MKRKDKFYDLLESYFSSYLPIAKGLSDATVTSYKTTFRLLFEFLITRKNVSAEEIVFSLFTVELIQEFLDWLETDRNNSVKTRNQRLSALSAFAQYAQCRDLNNAVVFRANVSAVPRKKGIQKTRTFFTRDEVKILLDAPDCKNEIGIRDKTLLTVMYASGMRAQEVCDMKVGDIQFYSDRAGIRILGKGKKMRRIGIPKQASKALEKYIVHRKLMDKKERHVFSSQTHEKMTISCIEEIFRKYIASCRSEHPDMFRESYSPHSMRHTTATHMLEAGVPLVVVKNFLGHASLQTTQIYAEVTQDTMNRQLRTWNEKWFLKNDESEEKANKNMIPDFLR